MATSYGRIAPWTQCCHVHWQSKSRVFVQHKHNFHHEELAHIFDGDDRTQQVAMTTYHTWVHHRYQSAYPAQECLNRFTGSQNMVSHSIPNYDQPTEDGQKTIIFKYSKCKI